MPTYKVPIYDLRLLTKAPMPMGRMGNSAFKSNIRTLSSMYGYNPDYETSANFVYGKPLGIDFVYGKPLGAAIYKNTNDFESLKYDLWKAFVFSDPNSFYLKNDIQLSKTISGTLGFYSAISNMQSKVQSKELTAERAILILMTYFNNLMSITPPSMYKGTYLTDAEASKILDDSFTNPNAKPTKEMYAADLLASCYFSSDDFKKGEESQRLFFAKMNPFLDKVYDLISKVSSSILKGEISFDVGKKFIIERFQDALKSGEMNTSFDRKQKDALLSASEWQVQKSDLVDETLGIDRSEKSKHEEISDGNGMGTILLKAAIGFGVLGGLTMLVIKKS